MAWNQTPAPPAFRLDGYVNMLNKYGTQQDGSEAYRYAGEGIVSDMTLTNNYETGGLFAKIIDAPAEEAIKHGFSLGLKENSDTLSYIVKSLERLEWEERASWAIKSARLYGGAIGVMLVDDGGDIDEPLNRRRIEGIEDIHVFERAVVTPDYASMYSQRPMELHGGSTAKLGVPEYYQVNSIYGSFWVHESRCLIFRNGTLPESTANPLYRFWGMPEYARIRRQLRETVTTHSLSVKLLERSVQAIYSMQGLARLLATEAGEDEVIKRLQLIDMARHALNSIAIDSEGESFDFKTATMSGVKEVVDSSCNMLSAVTNIPQTILFGRSPAGLNSTGDSDMENFYNFVGRIQKLMLKGNLNKLLDIVSRAGVANGEIEEMPEISVEFNPLWSMSDAEQADVEQKKAQTRHTKAQTAQIYVDMGAIDPTEVRKGLASEDEFSVEELLDDMDEEELWGGEGENIDPSSMADDGDRILTIQKLRDAYKQLQAEGSGHDASERGRADAEDDVNWITLPNSVHVPIGGNETKGEAVEKFLGEKENKSYSKLSKEAISAAYGAYDRGRVDTDAMRTALRDIQYDKDFGAREISESEAHEIIFDNVPRNVYDGWYREYNSPYKTRLEDIALHNDEVRNAALNLSWHNYREHIGEDIAYKDYLYKDIEVYRGKPGGAEAERYVEGDQIMSYSFDKKIAQGFAVQGGTGTRNITGNEPVQTATIRPIDTIGSFNGTGELETFVRRDSGEPVEDPSGILVRGDRRSNGGEREDEGDEGDGNDNGSVGVLVVVDGKVLAGKRADNGQLCGAGGHMNAGETPAAAAVRELYQEFGITPLSLKPLGQMEGLDEQYGKPFVYLCEAFEGEVRCVDGEMYDPEWIELTSAIFAPAYTDMMFPPFRESLKLLGKQDFSLTKGCQNARINTDNTIPKDKVSFATADNEKVYAFNKETGETSGLGPDIDSENEPGPNEETLRIPDEEIGKGVGAKAKNYEVVAPDGTIHEFAEGTKFQNSEVFAGQGTKTKLRDSTAEGLSSEYGGDPNSWQKAKATAVVDVNGEHRKAEVHWFQSPASGKVKFKVKVWLDES